MFVSWMTDLLGWMPFPLLTLCIAVVSIFSLVTILRLVKLILDVIPFL